MAVQVSFSTEQNCPCKARITEIGSVASDANAFPVKAGLIDPPDTIKAGMTAEIAVISEQSGEDVSLLVPLTAIAPGDDAREDFGFVFVYDPGESVVNKRKVSVRGAAGESIAVYEGVAVGDVLAVAGVSFLTDKQKVKLWNP
jgi:multidrug efflux pump subunit AcrA (membrane-fusion protein)